MSIDRVPTAQSVPESLREREQWVCWRTEHRDGEATKVPITPVTGEFASTNDPDSWRTFGVARGYATADDTAVDGVGFVFTDDDPFVGVDLDDCRDSEIGALDEPAASIVDRLDSYTEVSPSGTGVHVLLRGELPEGRNRRGKIELYDQGRYFTVTGVRVDEAPHAVEPCEETLQEIHAEHVARGDDGRDESADQGDPEVDPNGNAASTSVSGPNGGPSRASPSGDSFGVGDLTDEELLERAMSAANGEKFRRLWNGDTSGYDSHSEADMALCTLLAFWTGNDAGRMDRLFRQSGLMRPKWDEVHYGDGRTYGEGTIEEATAFVTETYNPGDDSDTDDIGTDGLTDGDLPSTGDGRATAPRSPSATAESGPASPSPTGSASVSSGPDSTTGDLPDASEGVTVGPEVPIDRNRQNTASTDEPPGDGATDDAPKTKEVPADATVVYGEVAEAIEDLRASIARLYAENQRLRERLEAVTEDSERPADHED